MCAQFVHIIANFCILITPSRQENYSNPMQIAFYILTEGIKQMYNTNTAEDYKKTSILISTMLHFLDPEFEYQCKEIKAIQKQITQHRNEKMANAVASNASRNLWDEIRKMDSGTPTANIVDGRTECDDIANVFATKYKTLYNSVGYNVAELHEVIDTIEHDIANLPTTDSTHKVSVMEVSKAIKMLNNNKCDGNQGIFTNHFKRAPKQLALHLSHFFSSHSQC